MPDLIAPEPQVTTILVTGASGLVGSAVRELIMGASVNCRLTTESGSCASGFSPATAFSTEAQFGPPESPTESPLLSFPHRNAPAEKWIFIGGRAECDLTVLSQTRALFEKYRPDKVLHLAALVGGVADNMARPCQFLRDNLLINDNVMRTSAAHKVEKLVSCLSTCIFPDQATLPLDESKIHLGPPHETNYGYAYAKRLVDIQNRAYHDQYGLLFTAGIPTNVFGPGDNFNLKSGHVMPCLIRKCYEAKTDSTAFVIWGTGSPLRQFIYNKDLAKLFVWQMRDYNSVEPIILSVPHNKEISIKDLAFMIAEIMQFNGQILFDRSKPDGQERKSASNEKLVSLLQKSNMQFSFTPLYQALTETIHWFTTQMKLKESGSISSVCRL